MGHAAIDDDGLVDALVDGVGHALDLGQHTARNDACGLVALDFGDFDLRDQRGFIVLIVEQTNDIRHADEFFCVQGNGNFSRGRVCVDVVGDAVVVHADGGNDRDEAVGQQVVDQRRVDLFNFADIAQIHIRFALAHDHVAVHAAQADAAAFEQRDQVFVDLPGQHLLDNAHGFFIGVAQTVHKFGFLPHALEHLVDGRPAAVYQHDPHTQQRQRDQVVHDGQFQFIVDHGIAAVLDNQRFAVVFLDIRCSLAEQQGHLFILHRFLHPLPLKPSPKGEGGRACEAG